MTAKTQTEILKRMVYSLNQASAAAGLLVHLTAKPDAFMMIRDALDLMKEGVLGEAPKGLKFIPKDTKKVIV